MKARRTTPVDLVVVLASTKFHGHQLYEQRLSRALAAHVPVLYVEPAVPLFGLGRASARGDVPEDLGDVRLVTPSMLPFGRRPALAVVTAVAVAVHVLVALARLGVRPGRRVGVVVCAAHPVTVRLLRGARVVALVKDDYVAGARLIGVPVARLVRRRRQLLRVADRVVVVSPVLRRTLLESGVRAVVVPPGCEPSPLRDHASPGSAPLGARAVFIGMVSDRISLDLIEAVVDEGVEVLVVGKQQTTFTQHARWEALLATGRVHALGPLGRADLLDVVQGCDIGLVPYVLDEFNLASFPLKTLEYLAAGVPVLSTALPAVEWLDSPHVHVTRSTADRAAVLARALADARARGTAAECVRFAARYDWASRATAFLEQFAPASR